VTKHLGVFCVVCGDDMCVCLFLCVFQFVLKHSFDPIKEFGDIGVDCSPAHDNNDANANQESDSDDDSSNSGSHHLRAIIHQFCDSKWKYDEILQALSSCLYVTPAELCRFVAKRTGLRRNDYPALTGEQQGNADELRAVIIHSIVVASVFLSVVVKLNEVMKTFLLCVMEYDWCLCVMTC